jgi:hypothetical protein
MKRSVVDFPNFLLAAALLLAACSPGRQLHLQDGGDDTASEGSGGGKGTAGSSGGASGATGNGGAPGGGGSAGARSGTGGTASGGTGGTASSGTGGTASGSTGGTAGGGTGGKASGGTGGTASGTGGTASGTGGTASGTGGTASGTGGTASGGTGGTGTGGSAGAAGGAGGSQGTGGGSGGAQALSIQMVDGRSTATSTTAAQVSPACPLPQNAIGAGWQLLTSGLVADDGYITYSLPSYDGSSWLANASPVDDSTPWLLDVSIECATVAGYQLVTATSPADTTARKSITATCPAGKQALGAGWGVLDSTAAILEGTALQFQLAADGTSWTVAVSNLTTDSDPWELRETVICAPASAVPGYQIVSAMSTLATGTRQQLRTACPSPKRAIMGGWSLVDGSNAPIDGTALLSDYSVGGTAWDTTVITAQSTTAALQVSVVCAN